MAISGDGNTAVIGGPLGFGAAWTFERTSSAWRQLGDQLVGTDVQGIPSLGTSVAISGDGNTIAVGGPLDSASLGATWIFVRSSSPPVSVSGVVNQANGAAGPVAPGEVVLISGPNFGPSLADISVQFDGIAAPVLSVSSTQIAAVTPFELMPGVTTSFTVRYTGITSAPVALQVRGAAPGLYSADGSGTGQGLILNADGTANSSSSPAFVGDVITITGTGGGQTNPPSADGTTTPDPPPMLALQVTVTFGGVTAYNVVSATGLAGEIAGKFAIAVAIPDGVGTGDVPVVVSIADVSSQDGLTVNIGGVRESATGEHKNR